MRGGIKTGIGRGKKGFGYHVRGGAGPGNTTLRELLAGEHLEFLRTMKVSLVKEGIIVRWREAFSFPLIYFTLLLSPYFLPIAPFSFLLSPFPFSLTPSSPAVLP